MALKILSTIAIAMLLLIVALPSFVTGNNGPDGTLTFVLVTSALNPFRTAIAALTQTQQVLATPFSPCRSFTSTAYLPVILFQDRDEPLAITGGVDYGTELPTMVPCYQMTPTPSKP
jgi:hypothetical protein